MPEKRECGIREDGSAMRFAMFLYPNGTVTDAHRAQWRCGTGCITVRKRLCDAAEQPLSRRGTGFPAMAESTYGCVAERKRLAVRALP